MKLAKFKIIMVFIVALLVLGFLYVLYLRSNDPIFKATGWTKGQFIRWAYKVEPVKEHLRWRISNDSEELMDPNAHFFVQILNDLDDINNISIQSPVQPHRYKYGWVIVLPKDVPKPVAKVLMGISRQDVGKYIDQILPYADNLLSICSFKKYRITGSEKVRVKLTALSEDKHTISVETEPFLLSDNPDIHGRFGCVVLFAPEDGRVNICE